MLHVDGQARASMPVLAFVTLVTFRTHAHAHVTNFHTYKSSPAQGPFHSNKACSAQEKQEGEGRSGGGRVPPL